MLGTNLTGKQFGKLLVVSSTGKGQWECRCSCGNIIVLAGFRLTGGNDKSCGCSNKALKNLNKEQRAALGKKISEALRGKSHKEEHNKNVSKALTGHTSVLKGKTYQEIYGERVSEEIQKHSIGLNRKAIEKRKHNYRYGQWVTAVKERDSYVCRLCGKKPNPRALHAHHTKPADEFPELQYDVSLGISLCNSCHPKEEKKIIMRERKNRMEVRKKLGVLNQSSLPDVNQFLAWLKASLEG